MKKFTLFLVATLFSALSFAALNPYAYGLSSSLSADQTTLTVNYSLNATATSVNVVILNGETVVKTVDCSVLGLTKGAYTTTIPTDELPKTTSLTWKVVVKGAAVTSVAIHDVKYNAYHPSGIDIDINPESPHFGRILCTEAMHSVLGKTRTDGLTGTNGTNYLGTALGAGIYEFDPAFTFVKGYNGKKTFVTTSNHYAPRRIRIAKDGRIFATAQDNSGEYLWEINPENLNSWTSVFQGTNSNFILKDGSGKFIAGTNSGFDVRGTGENLQLLMLSANKPGGQLATFKLHEYNLGNATTWSAVPTRELSGCQLHSSMITNQSQVQYDNEGGYWITYWVNNTASSNIYGGIAHFKKDGTSDFSKHKINMRNAGFRFNHDFTKVIIATNDITGASKTYKRATVYAVSKDANGVPVLTKETTIDMTTVGNNLNDFAWDYADNIYVVGNSSEYVAVYPYTHAADKVVSTPCASKYAFELQESVGTIYTVTATASPAEAGTVAGAGEYAQDTEVTLTATANTGYRFENWTVGSNTETANPLTFTITENITATANFVALTPYTINATANDANMGTVTGGGTYYEGETVTLTATPKTGYRFVNWSNSSTDAKLTFTASENLDLTANFEICTYTLTSFSNDETKGTVSGAGTYNYGATATLTATPTDGYKLLYWSDRSTENPRTITMAKNEAISAYFVKIYDEEPTFTITKVWENTNVPASTANGYQAVGWDGKIYMQNKTAGKIITYSSAEDTGTDYATSGSGQQIAVDEAGNLIVFNAYFATSTPANILIYKKGSTTGTEVSFTLQQAGQCHFFSASGDIYSADGGFVYFYCSGKTAINRLKITNGAATASDVTTDLVGGSIYSGGTQNHVMVDIFGNLVTHARSNSVNWINVYTNECKTFTLPSIKFGTLGGCSFELGGKELWAYHAGATNYSSEWNIYNMTDSKFLSDDDFYAVDKSATTNYACNWLNVQVVDENTAYIYQFCPLKAVAVWKVKMLSGPTLYTVTTTAENGTITGNAGTYEEGAEVTLTATPNRGYRFLNWTKGGEIVSTLPTYTFTITENIELVANFEALTPCTITVETSNAEQGSVTGGGTYYEGEEVTIKATAVGGFVFEKWSDDNTDNPRTITVSEAATYTAIFKVAPARVFAYNLDVVDNGNDTYTLSFIPNANATSGRVILYNDDTKAQIHEAPIAGTIAKGMKSEVVVSKSVMPTSSTVTWAVELTGEPVEALTLLTDNTDRTTYGFNRPQGVAIDNNPASDYFGRIYIALPKAGGTYYTDKNYGIVVMDPLHNRLKSGVVSNGDALGADGRYSMHRVAVNPTNGHVYYVRTSDSNEGVTGTAIYELTPDATNILTDGGTAKNVISGASDITNANSVCFDETGAMYVMANANYDNTLGSTGRVYKVIDGVATLFTPSSIEIASKDNAIVPDGKGGFWVAQHRNSLDGSNHLFHINTSGATDYYIDQNNNASLLPIQTYTKSGTTYKNASYRGQVAYYSIDENNGLVAYGGGAKVSVFKATYDGSGVPTLSTWQTISLLSQSATVGINVDGIAFDYAGNIIVMSATDERMYQYALPIETANTSLVPSPTSKAIKLGTIYTVEVAVNDPAMGTATGSGEYVEGETATLEATPAANHKFLNWTYGSEISTDNPLSLVVEDNITVTANFAPLPEITYELNGGVWNQYGWTSKKDMYDALLDDWRAYSGSTRTNVSYETQLGVGNSSKGIPTTITSADDRVAFWNLFADATYAPKWGWLATYVDAVAATQYKKMDVAQGVKTQPTSAAGVFTFTIGNFFGEDKAHTTDYIDAVDFTGEEAHLTAFAPYWGQTFPMPTQPTEEVVLNAPYKEGYEFDGWYANSDFSGAEVTTVDENTDGTLYAKWIETIITVTINEDADNTTNLDPYVGETVTATVTRNFGANKILTVTLPFDMSAAQISTYFGNATVYEFYNVVDAGVELHLQFAHTNSIEAGKPYILQTTTSGYDAEDGFTIENVTINTELTQVKIGDLTMVPVLDGGGTLNQSTQYYLSNNALYCAGDYERPLPGLRAFFTSASSTPIRARVIFDDNGATSIPTVIAPETKAQKIIKDGRLIIIRGEHQYNAQGQMIE